MLYFVFIITSAKEDMSVCLLATLHKKTSEQIYMKFTEGWQWASEQMITF